MSFKLNIQSFLWSEVNMVQDVKAIIYEQTNKNVHWEIKRNEEYFK